MSSPEKTSSKSTAPASNEVANIAQKKTDVASAATASAPLVASTTQLQRALIAEQDRRKEERFIWALSVMILLDVIVLPTMGWYSAWIIIFQLIFLFVFGRMCGVDDIYVQTQRAIDTFSRRKSREEEAPAENNTDQ